MSEHGIRSFTYQDEGLSYTVTVREVDGSFTAEITVTEGSMDLNAIYFGDDDFTGPSVGLGGPLNMNGGGSTFEGETIQWDNAIELSRPGLGREGTGKDTYLETGETYSVDLPISSLDEIDFFGVRATSTTTPEGSIKGVSGNPDELDDPETPDDVEYEKVIFATEFNGFVPSIGDVITWDALTTEELEAAGLEADAPATFENYVSVFQSNGYFDIEDIEGVVVYEFDENDNPVELFRFDGGEEGFTDAQSLVDAYNDATGESEPSQDLIMVPFEFTDNDLPEEEEDEDWVDAL